MRKPFLLYCSAEGQPLIWNKNYIRWKWNKKWIELVRCTSRIHSMHSGLKIFDIHKALFSAFDMKSNEKFFACGKSSIASLWSWMLWDIFSFGWIGVVQALFLVHHTNSWCTISIQGMCNASGLYMKNYYRVLRVVSHSPFWIVWEIWPFSLTSKNGAKYLSHLFSPMCHYIFFEIYMVGRSKEYQINDEHNLLSYFLKGCFLMF